MKPKNNSSNQQNSNKKTSGTNRQYDQNQGNHGKQLNPNNNLYWKARGHDKKPHDWKERYNNGE